MDVNTLIAQAANADAYEDQTIDTGGTFDNEPAPAGFTPARFIGYVEVGRRPQKPYLGKDKPPCDEVRLYFELNGKAHHRELVVDGVAQTFTNVISVKTAKKTGEKASFAKVLKKMAYGRDGIKHLAQMLGEGFLIQIVHNTEKTPKEGQKPKVYANMRDDEGNWLIQSPFIVDQMTNESRPAPIPETTQKIKLLLWNSPTPEQWDSLFIDGTRETKDAKGVVTVVSKNWLQEDIVKDALNYAGSPLQLMLGGIGDLTLDAGLAPVTAAVQADPAPGKTKQDLAAAPGAGPEDALASLGF